MISIFILAGIYIVFLGVLFFAVRNREKHFEGQRKELSRKLYEVSVLNNLQSNISHTLDIKKIAIDTVASGLENLVGFSCVSHAIIEEDRVVLKNYVKEPVNNSFINEVKTALINCVYELDESTRNLEISEYTLGILYGNDMSKMMSYFNIPIFINKKLIAVINVSSKFNSIYQEEDMSFLYRTALQAGKAIERLERVIETEKGKLNSMLTSLPNGALMFLFDEGAFKVSFINDTAKEFLKITDEPTTIRIVSSFGVALDVIKEIKAVLRDKKDVIINDVNMHEKYFKIVFSPVFLYGTDKIVGVTLTMQDMSLEKQIQNMRENFTHMLVHELRAPLISIRGGSELLMKGILTQDDKDKMLHVILDSSKRMLDQVGEILDAAKIEAGKFTIIKSTSDFASMLRDKVQAFSYVAQGKGINMRINIPAEIPQFDFDKERVGQVFNNFLSNAIKFTPAGGFIETGAQVTENTLTAWVKDNGTGIPKDKQQSLFSMYTQATTTDARQSGTGLGLYIAKSIVDAHNGKIWLESPGRNASQSDAGGEEGQGTTFYFTLPMEISTTKEVKEEVVKAAVPSVKVSNVVN